MGEKLVRYTVIRDGGQFQVKDRELGEVIATTYGRLYAELIAVKLNLLETFVTEEEPRRFYPSDPYFDDGGRRGHEKYGDPVWYAHTGATTAWRCVACGQTNEGNRACQYCGSQKPD